METVQGLSLGMLGCLGGIILVNTKGHTPALVRGDVGEGWELMEKHSKKERLGSQLDDRNLFSRD